MGVFGFGSCDSDTSLDILQDIQDAYGLCDPESRVVNPSMSNALEDLRAYDPLFNDDGGEARVAYRLLSDGFKLHPTVLEAALEWLRLEHNVLRVIGDSGSGWCAGGAERRRAAISTEIVCIAEALIESLEPTTPSLATTTVARPASPTASPLTTSSCTPPSSKPRSSW
jgi:hypothetical protein